MNYTPRRPQVYFTGLAVLLLGVFCSGLLADFAAAAASRRERRADGQETLAPPASLTPQSFSSFIVLDGRPGAVLSFPLPESVYRGLHRKDFTDMCVFDAAGTPVPFSLSVPQPQNVRHTFNLAGIRLYPWHTAKKTAMRLPMQTDVEIDAGGGIVRIRTQSDGNGIIKENDEKVSNPDIYVLDLKGFLDATAQLQHADGISFGPGDIRSRSITLIPEGDSSFVCSLILKTSSDLSSWRAAGNTQALARLKQDDGEVKRLDFALPGNVGRYLILEIQGDHPGFSTATAEADYSKNATPVMERSRTGQGQGERPELETRRGKGAVSVMENIVYGEKSVDGKNVIYSPPGAFPLVGIDFDLPQSEIMSVSLEWRDSPKEAWRFLRRGTVYRIEKDGVILRNEPFELGREITFPSYWRLAAAGDIPFAQAPGLRLLWTQHSLHFLARGQGPWTLAYGRKAAVTVSSLPLATLGDVSPASVISEAPATAAAPSRPGQAGFDKSAWLLWLALGVAAIFLSGLAFYLMRSMKKGPPTSK